MTRTATTTATTTATAPAADLAAVPREDDPVRRAGAAACLLLSPCLLLASHLLQPAHGTSTAAEVAAQAAHPGRYRLSTVVGLAAVVLLVPAVAALARLLPRRWSGRLGGALAHCGTVALGFLLGTGVGATTIAVHGGGAAVALTDRLESDPAGVVGVATMLLGWTFGLLVLAVGLARSRVLPVWAAAALGAAPFVPAFAGGRYGVAVGFVLLLVGFAAAARTTWRGRTR